MAVAILAEDGVRHCLGCRNDHNEHKVLAQIMSCGAWQRARPSTFSTLGFPQACEPPAAAGLERRAGVWGAERAGRSPRLLRAMTRGSQTTSASWCGGWDCLRCGSPDLARFELERRMATRASRHPKDRPHADRGHLSSAHFISAVCSCVSSSSGALSGGAQPARSLHPARRGRHRSAWGSVIRRACA